MIEQSLFDYFTTHHFPREEVLNRLPFSVSRDEFWPQLLQLRKARAVEQILPRQRRTRRVKCARQVHIQHLAPLRVGRIL